MSVNADTLLNVVLKLSMTVLTWCLVILQQKSRWVTCMKIRAVVDDFSVSKCVRLMVVQDCVYAWESINYSALLTAMDSYRWSQKNKSRDGTISNSFSEYLLLSAAFLRWLNCVFELRLRQYAKTRQNKSPAYVPIGSELDADYNELIWFCFVFCILQLMNANVVVLVLNKNKLFTFFACICCVPRTGMCFQETQLLFVTSINRFYIQSHRYFPLL